MSSYKKVLEDFKPTLEKHLPSYCGSDKSFEDRCKNNYEAFTNYWLTLSEGKAMTVLSDYSSSEFSSQQTIVHWTDIGLVNINLTEEDKLNLRAARTLLRLFVDHPFASDEFSFKKTEDGGGYFLCRNI